MYKIEEMKEEQKDEINADDLHKIQQRILWYQKMNSALDKLHQTLKTHDKLKKNTPEKTSCLLS